MSEFLRNPYVTGGAIATPGSGFYGRTDVFDFVRASLNSVQRSPILLYGPRRIGKTSLLRQMPNYLPADLVTIYFDLQGKSLISLDEMLFLLARDIRRHAALRGALDEVRREDITRDTFAAHFLSKVFAALGGDKYRLAFLFDEMDIIEVGQLDQQAKLELAAFTFRDYVRGLIEQFPQVGFVFVLGRRPEELNESFNAQIFRTSVQKRLGHLSRPDMERLVVEPAAGYLSFSPETLAAIYALTNGHPFCTQVLCWQLWQRCLAGPARYPVLTSPTDVTAVLPDALSYATLGLNWIYDSLAKPSYRLFLSAAAEVLNEQGEAPLSAIVGHLRDHHIILPEPEVRQARRDLVTWEIVTAPRDDTYRFGVEMIRFWVARNRSLDQIAHEARYISNRAYQLYEVADGFRQDGKLPEAKENYESALGIYPQLLDAQIGLADTLRQMEDWQGAIRIYERLSELDPRQKAGLREVLLGYGGRLEQRDQLAEAIQQYERAAELGNTPSTRERLRQVARRHAQWLAEQGRYGEARRLLERHALPDDLANLETAYQEALAKLTSQVDAYTTEPAPDWNAAHALVAAFLERVPGDEHVTALKADVRARQVRWYTRQGDRCMADGQYGEAKAWHLKAGNEQGVNDAYSRQMQDSRRTSILALRRQVAQGAKDCLSIVEPLRLYLSEHPDDGEVESFANWARQEVNREAEKELELRRYASAARIYEALGETRKALDVLLTEWLDAVAARRSARLTQCVEIVVLTLLLILLAKANPPLVPVPLLVGALQLVAAISGLSAIYYLCFFSLEDVIMGRNLVARLSSAWADVPSVPQARSILQQAEHVRSLWAVAAWWGVIVGLTGCAAMMWITLAPPRLPGGAWTIGWRECVSFLVFFAIGAGIALAAYPVQPTADVSPQAPGSGVWQRWAGGIAGAALFARITAIGLAIVAALALLPRHLVRGPNNVWSELGVGIVVGIWIVAGLWGATCALVGRRHAQVVLKAREAVAEPRKEG